jgi:hypothetical protein
MISHVPSTPLADLLRCSMQGLNSLGTKLLSYIWPSNVDLSQVGPIDNPHGSDIVIAWYVVAKDGKDEADGESATPPWALSKGPRASRAGARAWN